VRQWFRLARSTDIKRVRRSGKSFAHPLLVLVLEPNPQPDRLQVGVIAGKTTGGAVNRNLIKRRIKAILDQDSNRIQRGWNIVIISRSGAAEASFAKLREALTSLLQRARILDGVRYGVGS
jgi:ribonuclease P protein component